jgi:eukaryotic-like serine/threonine-protein kinase
MSVTPERWQQIARIYELAADQDPSKRDTVLSEACAGDEALRREVESLLSQDAAQVVVDRPMWATAGLLFDDGPDLRPGTTLGPYRVDGPLGAGGMGEVFRGTDTRLNRQVAIKVLPSSVALDQQMRARFAREAKAVAALTHPHICTLYDIGRHDEVDFLVMEYLEGDTLAARLADGPLSLDLALTHANEIAGALDHAHRHGVIHRDLKPANIMLTASGAKLLDFGLAKFRPAADVRGAEPDEPRARTTVHTPGNRPSEPSEQEDAHLTHDGTVPGTVRYMAPEQICGREVDGRSDVFSFGAVLYEMLTGKRAFDGDSATAVRLAILEREPPPVSSLQPLVPPAVDEIVRRCLAKDPDKRWQTAGDTLAELKRVSESSTLPRPRTGAVWKAVAAIFITAITGLAAWLLTGAFEPRSTPPFAGEIRSIAVLPFENLSGDPEQEYFADGMTEQLITELAKISGLRTISPTSVLQHRTARKAVPTIARELGVDTIVEGSVVRAGDTARITAKLIRAASGEIIWAESYERDLRDVLTLHRELARTIISKLGINVTPQDQERLASARPVNPEVHLQVLLGRYHVAKATEDGVRKGIQYFGTAVAADPASAMAHAGLAEAYAALSGFYVHPREVMPIAKQAAETALRLDESVADAHAVLGFIHLVYDWNGPAAEKELLRALDLNPTLASARLHYAAYLASQARNEESVREVGRAVYFDPLSARTHAFGSMFLIFSRRYEEAIDLARKGLELEPNHAFALAFQGLAYAEQGRFEQAIANLQRAAQRGDNPTIVALQAHVHALGGQKEHAKKLILQLEETYKDRYFCPYEIGHVYVTLGDLDTAYRWFQKGVVDRADCMAWLGVEPWLDPFRADQRYVSLIREVGLTPVAR